MPNQLAAELERAVTRESPELFRIQDRDADVKPSASAWSKKEELGHLIDSAANNQQRFVRAAIDGEYNGPGYQQNEWVERHGYNGLEWAGLVELWRRYNLLLVAVVGRIPAERMNASCVIGGAAPVTLRFAIEDYLVHMQHHVDHVVGRENVTPHPQPARPPL
jgi:hypothetical protein